MKGNTMNRSVRFSLAVSEELLGSNAPVVFQGGLAASARMATDIGFDAIEMHIRDPQRINFKPLKRVLTDSGLTISAIGTGLEYSLNGLSLTSEDPAIRRVTGERFRDHIELASEFGATVFVGLCRGRAPQTSQRAEYLERLAEELNPLVSFAEQHNVILSMEPIVSHITNLLNSTQETVDFLEKYKFNSVGMLLDTYHMHYEDPSLHDAFLVGVNRISHIHISDSDRRYPGSGDIDYSEVGDTLLRIGYQGAVSLEIEPYPSPLVAAQNGLDWMRSIWYGVAH